MWREKKDGRETRGAEKIFIAVWPARAQPFRLRRNFFFSARARAKPVEAIVAKGLSWR